MKSITAAIIFPKHQKKNGKPVLAENDKKFYAICSFAYMDRLPLIIHENDPWIIPYDWKQNKSTVHRLCGQRSSFRNYFQRRTSNNKNIQ
jgi:hypothetical protein